MNDTTACIDLIKEKIAVIRSTENKEQIRFVVLGAGNGVTGDFAHATTINTDIGILVEPSEHNFSFLLKEKGTPHYPNYTFHQFAVLPERFMKLNLQFHRQDRTATRDVFDGGSNFIPNHKDIFWVYEHKFVDETVKTVSVKHFIENYVQEPIDCLFMDIEGMDHDVVMEYIDYQQPNIIVFENWKTEWKPKSLGIDFSAREDCISKLEQVGYQTAIFDVDCVAYKI